MNDNGRANWWMYHGDPGHTGELQGASRLDSTTVKSLKILHTLQLKGPILSVPAVADGFVYVGVANFHDAPDANGGAFYKIDIKTGAEVATFTWHTPGPEGDTHGFTGMGCTPAVADGKVYFSAFNGKLYCLDAATLMQVWVTDLRYADAAHNQPVTNVLGVQGDPMAAGWSSPVVVNGKVYVGIGEGENPCLYSFVFCLDAQTGNVLWIYCTCKFKTDEDNAPNVLPVQVIRGPYPPGFTLYEGLPVTLGTSVWSSIAYDAGLNRIYCATGNPVPDGALPTAGYSNGVLALDADTGAYQGFFQPPAESSYRATDIDVDVGGSPTVFTRNGTRVVGFGCKNGGYFIIDADTMQCLKWRQIQTYYNDGSQIPTVDPHSNDASPNPRVPNSVSNEVQGENYSATYSTAAVHSGLKRLFLGIGGNNYHALAPGIDTDTTPFMRAMDWDTLDDAWDMDDHNPRRYVKPTPPMYTIPNESGLTSPAVVNDVVFCSTTRVAVYAFNANDGTPLWNDVLGEQTGGFNGGYGYCMGPAVWGDYLVAGALIRGRDGGILRIYGL